MPKCSSGSRLECKTNYDESVEGTHTADATNCGPRKAVTFQGNGTWRVQGHLSLCNIKNAAYLLRCDRFLRFSIAKGTYHRFASRIQSHLPRLALYTFAVSN